MKYTILKKATQVNSYFTENGIFTTNLSLLSEKKVLYSSVINISPALPNDYQNLNEAVTRFKNSEHYKTIERGIDSQAQQVTSSLVTEYNAVNNLTDLRYFNVFYPDLLEIDYIKGFTNRYIARFLNHNYMLDVSLEDTVAIQSKDSTTHFEAYDVITINWKLTGERQEVYDFNMNSLKIVKQLYGEFQTFYGLNLFESGPYYLTIYDEIKNLYSAGQEFVYSDSLENYGGFYHFIKNNLWSGNSDANGPNDLLIEGNIPDTGTDEGIQDILNGVNGAINQINAELNKIPASMTRAESQANKYINEYERELTGAMSEFLTGTDLEQAFNDSYKDAMDMQDDPNAQANVEKKYMNKIDDMPLSDADKEKIKKKGPKLPTIKIPKVHGPGRKRHEDGTDHAYELGF